MQKVTVFIDLDDTLGDTSEHIKQVFGYCDYEINPKFWTKPLKSWVKDYHTWQSIKKEPDFWQNIPLNRRAIELYEQSHAITPQVKILTALPKIIYAKNTAHFKAAEISKRVWIKRHFPYIKEGDVIVTHAADKHHQVKKTQGLSILIDDNVGNIKRWRKAGGIALHINHKEPTGVEELMEHLKVLSQKFR